MLVKRENFKYIQMQEYLFTHKKLQWNIEQKDPKTQSTTSKIFQFRWEVLRINALLKPFAFVSDHY